MFHPQGPTFFELAQQALSSTQRGYDLLAPKFEYTPFRTPDFILEAVAEHLQGLTFSRGLDLCCGTGAGLAMIRPFCQQEIVGIDFSQGMLAECRIRLAETRESVPLQLVRGDALALPFHEAFDLVTCFGAHGHIIPKDEPRFASEVWRVLRPGGRFVFVTSYWPRLWSPAYWLARMFNGAMHVRNLLIKPPFIMFYLTFMLPEVQTLLERQGFQVDVQPLGSEWPLRVIQLVVAKKDK